MKWYKFQISGKTVFPSDMLRYDGCFPVENSDVKKLCDAIQKTYTTNEAITINFLSHKTPTEARWESFGWTCQLISVTRSVI